MPVEVERLEGEPIIIVRASGHIEPRQGMLEMYAAVDALIKPDEKVFCITDLSEMSVSFSDLVMGMSAIREKRPGSPNDPRICNIMVGSGPMWNLASKAAKQLQYGGVDVHLFSAMEEAIEYARKEMKGSS